jgi:D-xylose transport system substrate-binding protein
MRKATVALVAFGLLATSSLTACTDDGDDGAAAGGVQRASGTGTSRVGVILPDRKSSQRWVDDDPRFLKRAFEAAGVPVDIQNADGDKAKFVEIARRMVADGVSVLMIVNLDSPSGKAAIDIAKAAGVRTIDYDRLTVNGGADYHVSFDNEEVGRLQGEGLVECLAELGYPNPVVAELNGSPTDNNAGQFKAGYDSVLQPKYDDAVYTKGPDQWVPDWKSEEGGAIFEQMLAQQPRIQGVLAANDGLAGAVIEVLKKRRLNGRVPVTGQDATVQGLRNILLGDQCMTVYKAIEPEARAAASLAIQLFRGETPKAPDLQKDAESGAYVPFVRLKPVKITKKNISVVTDSGFVDRKAVCRGATARLCKKAGI